MQHDPATTVYLALGANLGNRRATIAAAIRQLAPTMVVEQVSSLYETVPAYVLDQPHFLNAVLRGHTTLEPGSLLTHLKQIEIGLGRMETVRFGPRTIDLDILIYGDRQIATDHLTIPHPRMIERPFVLVPLAEIAPELIPSGWHVPVKALAAAVHGHGDVLRKYGGLTDAERKN